MFAERIIEKLSGWEGTERKQWVSTVYSLRMGSQGANLVRVSQPDQSLYMDLYEGLNTLPDIARVDFRDPSGEIRDP
jgi:hypothetical protein